MYRRNLTLGVAPPPRDAVRVQARPELCWRSRGTRPRPRPLPTSAGSQVDAKPSPQLQLVTPPCERPWCGSYPASCIVMGRMLSRGMDACSPRSSRPPGRSRRFTDAAQQALLLRQRHVRDQIRDLLLLLSFIRHVPPTDSSANSRPSFMVEIVVVMAPAGAVVVRTGCRILILSIGGVVCWENELENSRTKSNSLIGNSSYLYNLCGDVRAREADIKKQPTMRPGLLILLSLAAGVAAQDRRVLQTGVGGAAGEDARRPSRSTRSSPKSLGTCPS